MNNEERKPIKRSDELACLSRDHHEGLLLCWKIRAGARKGIANERVASYVMHFFEHHLSPHLQEEENFVFPLLPERDELRQDAVSQHTQLRQLILTIKEAPTNGTLLNEFADVLDRHIRFEERTLFPHIEKAATDKLTEVAAHLARPSEQEISGWEDEFWLLKQE